MIVRCAWATRESLVAYHDDEWGVPTHDDRALFELLTLEGAQAGLSWETVLRKRDGYRRVFANFDVERVAAFGDAEIAAAAGDPGIVRHRGKIVATVANAAAVLRVRREHGSFDAYLWAFVNGIPIVTREPEGSAARPTSALSDTISRDLRARGFSFVGSTIVQSYLQATGVRDDHRAECFRTLRRTG